MIQQHRKLIIKMGAKYHVVNDYSCFIIDDLRPHERLIQVILIKWFWIYSKLFLAQKYLYLIKFNFHFKFAMHDMRFALTKTRLNFYSVESPRQIFRVVHPFDAQ